MSKKWTPKKLKKNNVEPDWIGPDRTGPGFEQETDRTGFSEPDLFADQTGPDIGNRF